MNTLNLIILSIKTNKLAYFLTVIEIAVLLLTVNVLVSTIADRAMLDSAYSKVLGGNSVFVWDTKYMENKINGTAVNAKQSRELLLNNLEGEYRIYDSIVFEGNSANGVKIIALSDEIYNNLALPLTSGNYSGAVTNFGGATGKLIFDCDGISIELNVTGILTSNTFLPIMSSYSTGSDFTIKDFYVTSDDSKNFIITRKSSVKGYEDLFAFNSGFVIQFNDDNYCGNVEILNSKAGVTEGQKLLENSKRALNEDLKDFIPLLICVTIAVIIGTVSVSIIIGDKSRYRNGVLWLCGYSRRKIIILHLISIVFMFIISAIIYIFAYFTLSVFKINFFTSASFSLANIITTIIVCGVLSVLSMIVPIVQSRKTAPVEFLRRSL